MKSYTIIPHVADMRLYIEGYNLEELLLAGLLGMAQIFKKDFCEIDAALPVKHTISISALDTTSLLIDFLSKILTYSHLDRAIFCEANFLAFTPTALKIIVSGRPTNNNLDEVLVKIPL